MTAESTFAFRARDTRGEVVTGAMTAPSATEVGTRLRQEGKFPIAITSQAMQSATLSPRDADQIRRLEASKRVRREDVIAFCQQLSVMMETGVPLLDALQAFGEQVQHRQFRMVLASVADDLQSGESLSSALMKWPHVFPHLVVSLMKASEASGTMAEMLGRVGDYLAKERRTARQIRGAVAYPAFMISAGCLLTVFLMIVVLPRFAAIYEQNAATLPLPTRILLGISDVVRGYAMYYVPIGAGMIIGGAMWLRTLNGRRTADWLRLNLPILGGMFRQFYLTRASRTMSTLLVAGVNLLDIIEICRGVTSNVCFDRLWKAMEVGIRDGRQISDAVRESPYVPPHVASMIVSGERSGKLPSVMERIAMFSEEELENTVKKATAMIEPIMIILMGVIIGGVALALLLPIFSIGKVMTGG